MVSVTSWSFRATALGILIVAWPLVAQAPGLAMLDTLETGGWTLQAREGDAPQRLCVRSGHDFIQLRHRVRGCSHFVVEDGPTEVVIQYTCPGNGYGRTSIRRESKGLVQISSDGIVDGLPFSIQVEGRHSGGC